MTDRSEKSYASAPQPAAGRSGSPIGFLVKHAASAGIGVLAAVATVLAIDHGRARPLVAAATPRERGENAGERQGGETVVQRVVVDQQAFDRIAELERRLRDMEAAKAAASAAADTPPPDPAEERRRMDEMYAELDRAHERDPSDPGWAPGATKQFVTGLTTLGEKLGFTVGATDCKTTTCRSTVTWKNYSAARTAGAQLVEQLYGGLNCLQRIRLSEPADPKAPYSVPLYLDCTDLRAGVADEIAEARAD